MYNSYSSMYAHSTQMVRANQVVTGSHNKVWIQGVEAVIVKTPLHVNGYSTIELQ